LALDACGESERAERIARDALKHDDSNAKTLLAMGRILCRHERQTEATDYFARVLRGDPKQVEARRALAQAQAVQGDWDLAKKNFATAIGHAPLDAQSHVAFAEAALRMGDFAAGWEHFRWRFGSGFGDLPPHLAMMDPQHHPATWETGNLRKARLHLRAERTLAEQLLFVSLLPDALGESRSVLAEADPALIPLLQNAGSKATFAAAGSVTLGDLQEAKISLSSSLGDLARRFRADAAAFPGTSWLADFASEKTAQWRAEYQQCFPGLPLVGLSWRNGDGEDAEHLARLQPLFLTPHVGIISVQRGTDREHLASIASSAGYNFVVDPRVDLQAGLIDYAAQLAALDAVVAADDLTAILGSALGKPVIKVVADAEEHWAWGWAGASCVWNRNIHIMRKAVAGAHWAEAALTALAGGMLKGVGHESA